jgi:beta-galactosidase GanA
MLDVCRELVVRQRCQAPWTMRRHSLSHVAHGADAVCFFQWRQSQVGAEKFHSATVPHAGTDSAPWRSVVGLGSDLAALGEVAGSRVEAQVAVLFDWESWWASEIDSHPSNAFRYRTRVLDWYRSLRLEHVGTAVVPVDTALAEFRLVVVPHLYLADAALATRLRGFAEGGGTVVVTYFSGIADRHDHAYLGGYPGAFRDLLGVRVEEFAPIAPGDSVHSTSEIFGATPAAGSGWSEPVALVDADAVATYVDGPSAGWPALTRAARGEGAASYVTTDLSDIGRSVLVRRLLTEATVQALAQADENVELSLRRGKDGATYLFILNHGGAPHRSPRPAWICSVGPHTRGPCWLRAATWWCCAVPPSRSETTRGYGPDRHNETGCGFDPKAEATPIHVSRQGTPPGNDEAPAEKMAHGRVDTLSSRSCVPQANDVRITEGMSAGLMVTARATIDRATHSPEIRPPLRRPRS